MISEYDILDEADILDQSRELIMEALADWQPPRNEDGSQRAIFNVNAPKRTANDNERQPEILNATDTRRKGTSKLNCSEYVFDHLRIKRIINEMPGHLGKWLLYRYGESHHSEHLPQLIEVVISELGDQPKQQRTAEKVEKLVTKRLINEREFVELRTKDLFEAIGVSKSVYFRRYQKTNESLNEHVQALDTKALQEFGYAYLTQI
ncbi:hypothetical protein HC752_21965 [Vibrio sp. S9_S30]|uniref:bacteriophage antitermination protein Q n=1 Tax=Vibrio sp. S9_S30 TaxID=2720226 RepID=UPI0016809A96|nr:bacteriophage antitermination protein Q [Vibrio sp. S9_S30]MBD1559614.1 hypothetical protein [Vibrio sp. S9_S30]